MPRPIDNKKDILLLLLYSPGRGKEFNEPIVGRTRLVKLLFLFLKEGLDHLKKGTKITEDNFYNFFPWSFGPFSKQIYDDIMFFILRDFIEAEVIDKEVLPESAAEWEDWMRMSTLDLDEDSISEFDEQQFKLSAKGERFAKELYGSLSEEQKEFLRTFKAKVSSTPLRAILKYVYVTYPEFTDRSYIREQLIGRS